MSSPQFPSSVGASQSSLYARPVTPARVRPTSDSSTTGGLQSAGRAATPHKLRPSGDAQPGFDAAKKQVLGGGASPKVDAAKVSGALSGQLAETPLGVVAGYSARMRPSSALGQEFSPQSASLSGAPSRPFKPIQMDEGQMADACYVSGLKSFQVNLVLGALNQHLERNGGAFNREQFQAEVGETNVSDKLKAADFILENVLPGPKSGALPKSATKSAPVEGASSRPSVQKPAVPVNTAEQIANAKRFLEDQTVWGGGFLPGEYQIIQADSGNPGVCHTYSLGLASDPKNPKQVSDRAGSNTIAVCFRNGEVAHTAVKDGGRWRQLLLDNTTGKTHEFSTKPGALERAYGKDFVLIHRPGLPIKLEDWKQALKASDSPKPPDSGDE